MKSYLFPWGNRLILSGETAEFEFFFFFVAFSNTSRTPFSPIMSKINQTSKWLTSPNYRRLTPKQPRMIKRTTGNSKHLNIVPQCCCCRLLTFSHTQSRYLPRHAEERFLLPNLKHNWLTRDGDLCPLQEIPENAADIAHLAHLHTPAITSGVDLRYTNSRAWEFLRHDWKVKFRMVQNVFILNKASLCRMALKPLWRVRVSHSRFSGNRSRSPTSIVLRCRWNTRWLCLGATVLCWTFASWPDRYGEDNTHKASGSLEGLHSPKAGNCVTNCAAWAFSSCPMN